MRNHPINHIISPFFKWEKWKHRDLNNLPGRGRARIQTWICLTLNPVCFLLSALAHCQPRVGGWGEAFGWNWQVSAWKPWPHGSPLPPAQPSSEGGMAPGWGTAPTLPWQSQSHTASHASATGSSLSGQTWLPGSSSPDLSSDRGEDLPGAVSGTGTTGQSRIKKEGYVGHGMSGWANK